MLKCLQGLFVLTFVIFTACSTAPVQPKQEGALSVMSYNVENLFDTAHDAGKKDYTFLPLSLKKSDPQIQAGCDNENSDYRKQECQTTDWDSKTLEMKMSRLADTILGVHGEGPDILMVQEVENLKVLRQLNDQYLQKARYQTVVLIEGEDERGIDMGVLSRLPLAGTPKLHPMEIRQGMQDPAWKRPLTRGILEVPLKLPSGQTVTVMTFHFPSQASPVGFRQDAIALLNRLLEKKSPQDLVIAGGDSNISVEEESQHKLQKEVLGSRWKVSNLIGCQQCAGTENYRGTWNWFDVLLFSPSLANGSAPYQVRPESIRVVKEGRYQSRGDGTPARFHHKSAVGVSDHFPIYAEIVPAAK